MIQGHDLATDAGKACVLDPRQCYAAIQAHDPRFDGLFFVGVSTTMVYCRPVCRVRMPRADRCAFFPNAASAERAGFRPCLRCRPELAPGSAQVDAVQRVAHLAADRIKAGALTDDDMEALAAEFGLSSRQLRRAIESEYGVSPIALAQTYRLLLAKQLLTDSQLKIIDVAFASGFSSVRRFNAAFRDKYRLSPSTLRRKKKVNESAGIVLRLGYRPPLAWDALINFLCSRGNSRIECADNGRYFRTLKLGGDAGWIAAEPEQGGHHVRVEVSPWLLTHLQALQARLRALFDLDANPRVVEAHLERDPKLKTLLKGTPGLRVPGTLDGFELSLRAILGQQVTVKAATTLFGRFVDAFGEPVTTPFPQLDRTAPTAGKVADARLQRIIDLGLTQRRAETVQSVARGFVSGVLTVEGGDRTQVRERLLALPGIGPWTAQYIAMRALRDPNAFPHTDLGLVKALNAKKPNEVLNRAQAWQPWRAYGAMHVWHSLGSGG